MIEYQLKDANNNTFSLNGDAVSFEFKKTTTADDDRFRFDNNIIDRSFLVGSKLIGQSRLESRGITLQLLRADDDSPTYRGGINELISFARKTVYIVDTTSQMQIKVVPEDIRIKYEKGSHKKMSDNSFSFEALNPYWEALSEDSESGTAVQNTIKVVPIDNEGYLESYPIITLVATVPTNDIEISVPSENLGLEIQDSAFGTAGNLTMVIDCKEGTVKLNNDNRNVNIVSGTGFFPLPVGENDINILSNQTITYTIEWNKRYFV